jgi:hypothetical protein
MKHISKLFQILMLAIVLWSCEKDENRIYFEGATPPVLTSSVSGALPLVFANADKEALKLSWTNPEYQFTTGVSSQDVSYLLEIDTAGSNFTNPKRRTLSIRNDLSKSLTHGELNDFLLNTMELKPGMPHAIEMRLTASLIAAAVPMLSNVLQLTITPYSIPPKVTPPASGKLFITGSATPGGWQCACGEAELKSQQFTQISPTIYEITLSLTGGGSYKFVPVYGNWAINYGYAGDGNKNNVEGDDFRQGGNDILAPAAAGTYKIQVDFQRGKFTVTKV